MQNWGITLSCNNSHVWVPTLMPVVHTTPQGIWKRTFHSDNVSKCFLSTLSTLGDFETRHVGGHFGFVVEESSGREITFLSWCHRFRKASFSECFPPTVFWNSSGLKSVFEKLRFRWPQCNANGRHNRRNNAEIVLSNKENFYPRYPKSSISNPRNSISWSGGGLIHCENASNE